MSLFPLDENGKPFWPCYHCGAPVRKNKAQFLTLDHGIRHAFCGLQCAREWLTAEEAALLLTQMKDVS